MSEQLEHRAAQALQWLEQNRARYEQAKAAFNDGALAPFVREWIQTIQQYRADDPAHKAVYLVAKLQVMAEQWRDHYEIIQQYEKRQHERAMLLDHLNGVPSHG